MSLLISVIIPVYNVENYLSTCLDSILTQSLDAIEVIVVNDGSLDSSYSIMQEYAQKDDRIVCIDQVKNEGQGIARNTGLELAKGEYVFFVDSDDWIPKNALETLLNAARYHDVELVEANYTLVKPGKIVKQELECYNRVMTGNEYLRSVNFIPEVVWNKLWKRDFLKKNKLTFDRGIFEDSKFVSDMLFVLNGVVRIEDSVYNYIIRQNSTMTLKASSRHLIYQLELMEHLERNYLKETDTVSRELRFKTFVYVFVSLAKFINGFEPQNKEEEEILVETKKRLKDIHLRYRALLFSNSKIGKVQKVLLYISPYLMHKVFSWYGK